MEGLGGENVEGVDVREREVKILVKQEKDDRRMGVGRKMALEERRNKRVGKRCHVLPASK